MNELLESAPLEGGEVSIQCSLEDLDALLNSIAAEANHTKSRKLLRELDALYDRLEAIQEGHYI